MGGTGLWLWIMTDTAHSGIRLYMRYLISLSSVISDNNVEGVLGGSGDKLEYMPSIVSGRNTLLYKTEKYT